MKFLKAFALALLVALSIGTEAAFGQTVFNIRAFGAKCDNVTDDAVAIGKAFTAAAGKGAVYIPTSSVVGGACLVSTEIAYNVATSGPISIYGDGPTSILKASGVANKVLHLTGTAGVTSSPVDIRNLAIQSATSGTSAAGLHLDGIAYFRVANVWIDGKNKMTNCFQLTATQQGEVAGGSSLHCTTGALLESSGAVFSNGVDWHGMTFVNTTTNFKVTGSDDGFFHANHLTSAAMQIDLASGVGMFVVANNHLEPLPGNNGMTISAGKSLVTGNSFYGNAGTTDINITGGADHRIVGNLIDANVTIGAAAADTIFAFNSTGGTITNAGTRTRNFNNHAFAGTPLPGSNLYDHLTITSQQAAGAAMLTLNPPAVAGDWGMKINGAGSGDIYLQLNDVTVNGSNATGILTIKSGVAGTTWGTFTASGFIPTTKAFATLGTPVNGQVVYCTDCTIANPCAAAGTGAIAKRLNGVWVCN